MPQDQGAVAQEMLRHEKWLRGVLQPLVRDHAQLDDVVQQVFVATLVHTPRNLDNARGWLLRVALNELGMRRRRRRVRERKRHILIAPVSAPPADIDVMRSDSDAFVRRAIGELRSPYREVLDLHYLHDVSLRHVADALDRPPATVRSQAARGRGLLRTTLEALALG